jgi:TRAP-type mannitol/chloroaromatic compound transport system permease small subunit
MMLKMLATLARAIDALNERIGNAVAWLTLAMVLVTFCVVVLRYVFDVGFVRLQESYVWMHGIVFMLGAGYTLLHQGHVRVDVVYRGASRRYKAWVDLGGVLLLLWPMLLAVWWVAWPYVTGSWSRLEASREAGGLPGLFLLKTVILGFCLLLALQGLSLAIRSVLLLIGRTGAGTDANGDPGTGDGH